MIAFLVIWHSRTGQAEQMARCVAQGARDAAKQLELAHRLDVQCVPAHEASAAQLLQAQGYVFCAPENLAALSGEMKACLDRCYYPLLDRIAGRPYGAAISAGTDGNGAARQLARIATGWRLRAVAQPLIILSGAQTPEQIAAPKTLDLPGRQSCLDLGGLVAATLLMAE